MKDVFEEFFFVGASIGAAACWFIFVVLCICEFIGWRAESISDLFYLGRWAIVAGVFSVYPCVELWKLNSDG